MATSGSNSTNFVTKYYLSIEWSAVANSSKTSYTVTANVYLSSAGSSYPIYSSASKYGTITIDGTSYSFSFSSALNGSTGYRKLIGSASKSGISPGTYITVSASAGVNITFNPGGYIGTVSVSSYGTLDILDIAAPTFTASVSSKTLNTFVIKWSASATCSSIQYSLDGGGSWDTASGQSGTSGSFTISGLKPQTNYSIIVCGYGSASSKWGYGTIGNVMTMNLAYLTVSSKPTYIELTADSDTSGVYLKPITITFDITNESKSNLTLYPRNVNGASVFLYTYLNIQSTATTISITLEQGSLAYKGLEACVDGNTVTIVFDLYTGNGLTDDHKTSLVMSFDAITNYTVPVIQAIYGNTNINKLYCICELSKLFKTSGSFPVRSKIVIDLISSDDSSTSTYDLTWTFFDATNISDKFSGDSNLILFVFEQSTFELTGKDYTFKFSGKDNIVKISICDGYNTVVGYGRVAVPTSDNKASIGFGTFVPTKSIEFIEGLPVLYYTGGYLGGSELVEDSDGAEYAYPQISESGLYVNEFKEY